MHPVKEDTKDNAADELEKKAAVRAAADVLQSMSKAIKALKLYPDNSPVRQKFVSDLTNKFTRFLEEYGDLSLTVKQFDLLYEGEIVYNQQVKEDSIAFKFFGDGIREIAFSEKLDEKELLEFIDVIQGNSTNEGADDDIVTLMWKKEFKNIRYVVIENAGDSEYGQEIKRLSENSPGSTVSTDALRSAHKAESGQDKQHTTAVNQSAAIELEIEQIYGKPFGEIFVLTPEEIDTVKQEMAREARKDLVLEMIEILFSILEIEDDTGSYAEIMNYTERAVKTVILSGDYENAIDALKRITGISCNEGVTKPEHAEAAHGLINSLGDEGFLQQLTESLNASKADNVDELYSILTMLNTRAVLPLITMLSAIEQVKVRRVVCDALAVIAKDNLDTVLRRLQDDNWFIVRNIVYVLGRIGDAKVISHLRMIKDHREPRVRKEIIHTLSEIKSDEAKNILVSYLNDSDNTVRVSALKRLSSLEHRKAVPQILQSISSEAFDSKENYEKKELFEALASLGTTDQLPFLRELLMKKSWLFGRAIHGRRWRAACRAGCRTSPLHYLARAATGSISFFIRDLTSLPCNPTGHSS